MNNVTINRILQSAYGKGPVFDLAHCVLNLTLNVTFSFLIQSLSCVFVNLEPNIMSYTDKPIHNSSRSEGICHGISEIRTFAEKGISNKSITKIINIILYRNTNDLE